MRIVHSPCVALRRLAACAALFAGVLVAPAAAAPPREQAAEGVLAAHGASAHASIVHGTAIDIAGYPWIGAILNDDLTRGDASRPAVERLWCGGTLIAPSVVLTAAHCVTDRAGQQMPPNSFHVLFGASRIDVPGGESVDVARIERDPEYNPNGYTHDAALFVLARPVAIAPAALAGGNLALREGRRASIAGWGVTSEQSSAASATLQGARLPLWSNARCYAAYKHWLAKHEPALQLCAAPRRGGVDTCYGDSGGPLILNEGGPKVLGIVSFGNGCAKRGYPGIYTWAASPFMQPWIARRTAAISAGNPDVARPAFGAFGIAGGRVAYTVSEPGTVVFSVQRRVRRHLAMLPTALVQDAAAGGSAFPVPRRLHGRRLSRGTYILRATVTDAAGNRSTARRTTFRVR